MPKLRSVKRKTFVKFLIYIGCFYKRTKGDHDVYDRSGLKRPIIITNSKDVPELHIRTNLRALGISIEEFLDIIDNRI